jgi:hypothetical protein
MRHRLLLLVLAALLLVPAAAQAADSHAPHGARLDWLPSDEWAGTDAPRGARRYRPTAPNAEQMASLPAFMRHTYRTPSEQVSFLCRPH